MEREPIETTEEEVQLVAFKLGDEEYGISITQVQEIIRTTETTRIPQTPEFVEGVINLRGNLIPIIDLKKRFKLPGKEADDSTRIIIVEVEDQTVGIIVDAVSEVLRLSNESIEPTPPGVVASIDAEYLKGVGKMDDRLLIILDIDRLLTSKEKQNLKASKKAS